MTWIEKLKAKLKEKGLPEYLSGLFKGSTDEDISKIIDGFGDVKADAPEFENTLNSVVSKNVESVIDSRVNKAVNTHETKLKNQYNFVEKNADSDKKTETETTGEIGELKALVMTLSQSVKSLTEKGTKDQLIGNFLLKAKEEKKLPESWAKKYVHLITKDEDVEAVLGTAEKEYTEISQHIINEKFGDQKPPIKGGESATDTIVVDYAKSKNENKSSGQIAVKQI